MRRGRPLVWTIIGSVVAAVAVVIAVTQVDSGTPSTAASSPPPPGSAASSPRSTESAPVVTAKTSSTFAYLSDMHPAGSLGELVNPGPVKISGSIYPKSISFYCNVGDPTAFPKYKLTHNARRFQATIGLPANSSPQFKAAVLLESGGRTLSTFNVSARKPKTVDVDVRGVHTLQLECFGSGNSYTGGEAIALDWGNARVASGA
jgi:NPCBM/NEW2 domain